MAKYDSGSKGSTKIDNTSRDVGASKAPTPATVRAGNPALRTQEEIGGGLGNTENDRG